MGLFSPLQHFLFAYSTHTWEITFIVVVQQPLPWLPGRIHRTILFPRAFHCARQMFSTEKRQKRDIWWRMGQERGEEGGKGEWWNSECRNAVAALRDQQGCAPHFFWQHMIVFGHLKDKKNQHRDILPCFPPHWHHHRWTMAAADEQEITAVKWWVPTKLLKKWFNFFFLIFTSQNIPWRQFLSRSWRKTGC